MEWRFTVHDHTIRLYIDSEAAQRSADLEARRVRMEACLNLLPPEHIRLIAEPIIVVDRFPGGRRRGGGWFPPASSGGDGTVAAWLGETGAARTRVPAREVLARVGGASGTGIIGITSHSFLLDEDWGHGHLAHEYTLLHELAHSVDYHAGLIPPSHLPGREGNEPYQGQRYEGGGVHELAAEAYSRFFLRPSSLCRGGRGTPPCVLPDGSRATGRVCPTQRRCSARTQRDLQNTPAFRMTSVVFPLASLGDGGLWAPGRARYASNVGERRGPLDEPHKLPAASGVSQTASWRVPGPVGVRSA